MKKSKSLARYIIETRERAGLCAAGLAKKSGLTVEQIDDIEAGKDLFLSATVRQKLAKALKITPFQIKEYERIILDSYDTVSSDFIKALKKAVLDGETENLRCPICSSKLVTKVVRLIDLENNTVLHPKAHCSKCSFQIK